MSYSEKIKKQSIAFLESVHDRSQTLLLLLLGTTFLIALLLFPNLLKTAPQYQVGDVVQKDIKAPKDFLIEDKEVTQKRREKAARSVLMIYDLDDTLSAKLAGRITQAFEYMRDLSSPSKPDTTDQKQPSLAKNQKLPPGSLHDLIWKEKENFEKMLEFQVSKGAYSILEKENFSDPIANHINL